MRTFTLFILTVLFFSMNSRIQNSEKIINGKNTGNLKSEGIIPALFSEETGSSDEIMISESVREFTDKDWYRKVTGNIQDEEYHITYSKDLGAYQSPNRRSNIRFIYHRDGFTAVTRDPAREPGEGFCIDINLTDVNRQKREVRDETCEGYCNLSAVNSEWSMLNSELKADRNKAAIENENMRIDYTNDKDGMRQDFIIKNKPEGDGKLRLNLTANTKLKMVAGADALMFKDDKGIDKMKYSALKCWDANGRVLRAYFENSSHGLQTADYTFYENNPDSEKPESLEKDKKSFAIVVNDEDAVYPVTIDPLSASPSWSAESNQTGAQFGFSVSAAGDVNGDGYSDVIAGSPDFFLSTGKAFLFSGSGSGISATPDWTYETANTGEQLGFSVSTAGDINGDGYADVIAGCPNYSNGENSEGRALLFQGSSTGLSAAPNWTNESNQVSANYGNCVFTAGDINGDGYSDVIAGSKLYDNGETDEGSVFVYNGSPSGLSSTVNWTSAGGQTGSYFGLSAASAGDVNGDGYADIIIGAPSYDNGETDEGKFFAYYGSASG
ncbi:MAG: FG-GAP repeat protein, partial [Ignavibacteria bacterium]|nr:FG-GAP repeat protein [Ignavibacteria bacterium]